MGTHDIKNIMIRKSTSTDKKGGGGRSSTYIFVYLLSINI